MDGAMRNIVLIGTLLLLVLWPLATETSFAKKRKRFFPHGCEVVGFQFKNGNIIITPENQETEQALIFFNNATSRSVHLRYIQPPNMYFKEELETTIAPRQWTVLASHKPYTELQCRERVGRGEWEKVDCDAALKYCQYPRVKFASHNGGTYWASESKSLKAARYEAIRTHGILLRW